MNLQQAAADPAGFRTELHLPTALGDKRFGDIMAPFQAERFAAVDPTLLAISRGTQPPLTGVFDVRTKGGSKDTDWCVSILLLLATSRRELRIQAAAADREQVDELRKIARSILRIDKPANRLLATGDSRRSSNPKQLLDVRSDSIVNTYTGGTVEFLTKDSRGSHGARPDLLFVNELTHIDDGEGREFVETLYDNADKVSTCVVIIACNAGWQETWQAEWKQLFADSPTKLLHEFNEPAPWISADKLAESKRRNSASRFARLWGGEWLPPGGMGDAFDEADILAMFPADIGPLPKSRPGYIYVGGLDLGVKHDNAAFVVCEKSKNSLLRIAYLQTWIPTRDRKVDLQRVRESIAAAHRRFRMKKVATDPWQAELLVQELRQRGVPIQERAQSAKAQVQQTGVILQAIREARLVCYGSETLKGELRRARIVDTKQGQRLVSPRDKTGHGDTLTAASIAIAEAAELKVTDTAGALERMLNPSAADVRKQATLYQRLQDASRRAGFTPRPKEPPTSFTPNPFGY